MHSKPAISLRRPPSPAAVDAFVSGRPDVQTPGHLTVVEADSSSLEHSATQALEHSNAQVIEQPDVRTLEHLSAGRSDVRAVGVVERADGRQRRRLTVYLPVELAKRLVVHCAAGELEMSDVVTEAVERELARG